MGGPQTTETRLDTMFVPGLKTTGTGTGGGNGIGTTLFNPGKFLNLLKRNLAPKLSNGPFQATNLLSKPLSSTTISPGVSTNPSSVPARL